MDTKSNLICFRAFSSEDDTTALSRGSLLEDRQVSSTNARWVRSACRYGIMRQIRRIFSRGLSPGAETVKLEGDNGRRFSWSTLQQQL